MVDGGGLGIDPLRGDEEEDEGAGDLLEDVGEVLGAHDRIGGADHAVGAEGLGEGLEGEGRLGVIVDRHGILLVPHHLGGAAVGCRDRLRQTGREFGEPGGRLGGEGAHGHRERSGPGDDVDGGAGIELRHLGDDGVEDAEGPVTIE